MDFINRIDAESDELIMSTIKSEYGFMLQIGALFANLRPKWRILSIIQFTIYTGMVISHLGLFIKTLSINYKDTNSALQTLHYGSLVSITFVILISFPLNRPVFVKLIRIVGNNYYTYSDGLQSDLVNKWKNDIRKIKIILLILIPCYLFFCAVSLIFISPMIDTYTGVEIIEETYTDGIYTKLPLKLWYPFIIDTQFKHIMTLCLQVFIAGIVASVIACADLLMIFVSQGIAVQMKILRNSIQNIENRAGDFYAKKFGELNRKDIYSNKNYMKMINFCIKENVQHHIVLLKAFNNWYLLQKWPMAYALVEGSLIIALSLIGFVMGETRLGDQFLSLLLLVAEVATFALFCFVGQQMSDLSEGMLGDLYNLNWMKWNKSCQLSFLIVKEFMKNPLELKAGGLKTMNLSTFASIMNGAYSYFNLIYAYKGDS
ncbi:hypothetical protein O3M35_011436 [Rhynocoris fuscipes]|uniref:Odorant receptor n=1 Tax=Rhynocoris fuscipes TaxID=488301 RepID=A0AAW1D1G4_9HEMI